MTAASSRPDLRRIGESAFIEVLNTLLRMPFTVGDAVTHPPLAADARDPITCSVPLAGQRLSGTVHVQLPTDFVTLAVGVLTGLDPASAEAKGLLEDTAGELANIVAGRIAARLTETGYACTLATPLVSRGSRLPVKNQTAPERARTDLICEGHRLAVEIQCRYTTP